MDVSKVVHAFFVFWSHGFNIPNSERYADIHPKAE